MKVVIDIEANGLVNPTKIWVIVCKDISTGNLHIFRRPSDDAAEKIRFLEFASRVTCWIGHNFLDYDYPVLTSLMGLRRDKVEDMSIDTLIISRLVDYSRTRDRTRGTSSDTASHSVSGTGLQPGISEDSVTEKLDVYATASRSHSLEAYGVEFGLEKIKFTDFTQYSEAMENYCVRDVEICLRVYRKYHSIIVDPDWQPSILLEHQFQIVVNGLHTTGFCFDRPKAAKLLEGVSRDLAQLDGQITEAFPPRERLVREFTPKLTKFGTISRTSVPRTLWANIADYAAGQTYQHTRLEPFNPSSHKQVIEILNSAGWKPVDKTQAHIDTEREL